MPKICIICLKVQEDGTTIYTEYICKKCAKKQPKLEIQDESPTV